MAEQSAIAEFSKVVDTDHEDVRAQRAINQYEFFLGESNDKPRLSDTLGKPALERYWQISDALFPSEQFPHFDKEGRTSQQLVSRQEDNPGYVFARLDVAPIFQANLFQLIDSAAEQIIQLGDEQQKTEAALRLAAILFVVGIMIHPSVNGNRQRLICMITSYLHELSPTFQNSYFPLKYSEILGRNRKHEIMTDFPNAFTHFETPPLEVTSERDKALLLLASQLRDIVKASEDDENWEELMVNEAKRGAQAIALLRQASEQLGLPELGEDLDTALELELGPLTIVVDAHEKITHVLAIEGFDEDQARSTVGGRTTIRGSVTYALQTLLSRHGQGLLKLKEYILTDEVPTVKTEIADIVKTAIEQFEKVKAELAAMFSNPEVSSKDFLEQQLEQAKRYQVIAKELHALIRTDHSKYRRISEGSSLINYKQGTEATLDWMEEQLGITPSL